MRRKIYKECAVLYRENKVAGQPRSVIDKRCDATLDHIRATELHLATEPSTKIFVRTYRCNSCRECFSRQGQAGDATLWTDCDSCKGPAHWCFEIPCRGCVLELPKQNGLMGELLDVEEQEIRELHEQYASEDEGLCHPLSKEGLTEWIEDSANNSIDELYWEFVNILRNRLADLYKLLP